MIAICTPSRDVVTAGFAFDLVQLVKKNPLSFFTVSLGTLLPNQRTELVKRSIEGHASHILFIDSDMRFPDDTIERLKAHDKDIVAANCRHRQANKWTAGFSSKGKTGLTEVKSIGFGVTLIRTDVFFKMAEPWFATPYDGVNFIGEDVYFCHMAKEAGFKIYIDNDLSQDIKHTGSVDFGV